MWGYIALDQLPGSSAAFRTKDITARGVPFTPGQIIKVANMDISLKAEFRPLRIVRGSR
jgi:hypothetical protein